MKDNFVERFSPKINRWLWFGVVIFLPITSLPLIIRVIGSEVAAPSMMFLALMVPLWLLPYLYRGGKLPRQTLPIVVFILVALIASFAAFFIEIPVYKGKFFARESLDAMITLAIGMSFYFVATTYLDSSEKLTRTLQLINWSGVVIILWSLVQAVYIYYYKNDYSAWARELQSWLAPRKLFPNRVTGLAFEPSWLAHQLNMLYLPIWLGATYAKKTVHKFRIWKFTFENVLLAFGVAVLLLSISRVGWLGFALVVAWWGHQFIRKLSVWVQARLIEKTRVPEKYQRGTAQLIRVLVTIVLVVAYFGAGVGLVNVAGKFDGRLESFFEKIGDAEAFYPTVSRLRFAERVIYWHTGFNTFGDYPWLGVGLGNSGFFFPENVPLFYNGLNEINYMLYRQDHLLNTKSMWSRLLAETGIIGFSVFVSWLYVLWGSARQLRKSAQPILQVVAYVGIFTLLMYIFEGFSIDSFAMPYLWFTLGVLTAGINLHQKTVADSNP